MSEAADTSGGIVGVDVGGTFTDLVVIDPSSGEARIAKVPTTPENEAFGVLTALDEAEVVAAVIATIVHGTTTTTNALLERKISRCGLITTLGFRDSLELGRRTRPNAYGLTGSFEPLIPRELRREVDERVDAEGQVVRALDEEGVARAVEELAALGAESLVIHFLHAYANPAHERRAREIAAGIWPNDHITMGHAVMSAYREYERGTTAAVNAAVQPILHRYLTRLQDELRARGYPRDLLVMQGNGGTVSSRIAARKAVTTVMSGPASGVIAAAYAAGRAGFDNVITYDMGGTSTDVALIQGGLPEVSAELELEYAMPIHVPMIEIHSIGAGGGSIASLDEAGMLQVGPRSAGAEPGPVCYGRGGEEPTITDANLVLGRLNPETLLAVHTPVPAERLRRIIGEQIGAPLDLDPDRAAAAILRIAIDRMAGAIRMVSLSRGHDPRDFTLFAFGGAGPMHATALARELAIPRVLVPPRPGITNAVGCVVADVRHDYVNTVNRRLEEVDMAEVGALLRRHAAEGERTIRDQGVEVEDLTATHGADMQYEGQSHLLRVPLDGSEVSTSGLGQAFERAHWERFGVELPEVRPVLVNLHTAVIGRRRPLDPRTLAVGGTAREAPARARAAPRRVWFDGSWRETQIHRREDLTPGASIEGPAIVEQFDATIVVEPDCRVAVDADGNLVIEVAAAGGGPA